jgi:hypothetical protein
VHAEPTPDAQVAVMLQRINELDSLVTLKDKFVEKKLSIEANIKVAEEKLAQASTSGPKSTENAEAECEELKVRMQYSKILHSHFFRICSPTLKLHSLPSFTLISTSYALWPTS